MKIRSTLCRVNKPEIEQSLADLAKVVKKAKFVCGKCARASRYKKHLCKPIKLKDIKKG